jgi:hypothetical protein
MYALPENIWQGFFVARPTEEPEAIVYFCMILKYDFGKQFGIEREVL